jgi:hypothetical protein
MTGSGPVISFSDFPPDSSSPSAFAPPGSPKLEEILRNNTQLLAPLRMLRASAACPPHKQDLNLMRKMTTVVKAPLFVPFISNSLNS